MTSLGKCVFLPGAKIYMSESCDNRNLDAILCPKCPGMGIARIDFIILGKLSGNMNVGGIFEEMLVN